MYAVIIAMTAGAVICSPIPGYMMYKCKQYDHYYPNIKQCLENIALLPEVLRMLHIQVSQMYSMCL